MAIAEDRLELLKALEGILEGRSVCSCGHRMSKHADGPIGCLQRANPYDWNYVQHYCQCKEHRKISKFYIGDGD